MSKRGKKQNATRRAAKQSGDLASKRFMAHLEGEPQEIRSFASVDPWRPCHCDGVGCYEFYPLEWVRELYPVMQKVHSDGFGAWLEQLTQVVYDADRRMTFMAPDRAEFMGSAPFYTLNISQCSSVHEAARLWRKNHMDVFADLVVDACAGATAMLTDEPLDEPLASLRWELRTRDDTALAELDEAVEKRRLTDDEMMRYATLLAPIGPATRAAYAQEGLTERDLLVQRTMGIDLYYHTRRRLRLGPEMMVSVEGHANSYVVSIGQLRRLANGTSHLQWQDQKVRPVEWWGFEVRRGVVR